MNRARTVREFAPVAPPCFETRSQWLTFLDSAAEQQRPGHSGPLVFEAGEPVRFNKHFSFCIDCTPAFKAQMREAGQCHPKWLKNYRDCKEFE